VIARDQKNLALEMQTLPLYLPTQQVSVVSRTADYSLGARSIFKGRGNNIQEFIHYMNKYKRILSYSYKIESILGRERYNALTQ